MDDESPIVELLETAWTDWPVVSVSGDPPRVVSPAPRPEIEADWYGGECFA